MMDYDEAAINRFTRTFTEPDLEEGYIEDRWEKNKRFIKTVVIAGHFLFYPILIDDVNQLGPGVSNVPVTYPNSCDAASEICLLTNDFCKVLSLIHI